MTARAVQKTSEYHLPVMPDEVMDALAVHAGGVWVDGTVGGGGHSERILEACAPDGRLIAIDRDEAALAASRMRLEPLVRGEPGRLRLIHASFDEIEDVLEEAGVPLGEVDGALLDLGVSSRQIDDPGRGFSFQADGPLDMRMDRSKGASAADLANSADPSELVRILREYGEEKNARKIADRIVGRRAKERLATTQDLVECVRSAFGGRSTLGRIHVATRTFQAFRIAVNGELEKLTAALPRFLDALKIGGRLAVISFHSLEDRIVKQTMREWATGCICPPKLPQCVCGRTPKVELVSRKAVQASAAEIRRNPRARSAMLRAVEKRATT